jgi:hypothetical protein
MQSAVLLTIDATNNKERKSQNQRKGIELLGANILQIRIQSSRVIVFIVQLYAHSCWRTLPPVTASQFQQSFDTPQLLARRQVCPGTQTPGSVHEKPQLLVTVRILGSLLAIFGVMFTLKHDAKGGTL